MCILLPIFLEVLDRFRSRRFVILPDADDLAQGRADMRVRSPTCVPTHARAWPRLVPATFRGKDVSCSNLNTRRIFQDKSYQPFPFLLPSLSGTHRLRMSLRWCPPEQTHESWILSNTSVWLNDTSVL